MTAYRLLRNSLLTGVCIGLLTGCSWLEDWPPKNSGSKQQAQVEAPPRAKVMQTADSTWIEPGNSAQEVKPLAAMPPNTAPMDGATADRIAQLENEISQMRNDLNMIMPALTKIAAAQGSLHNSLQNIEPAAGGQIAVAAPQPVTPPSARAQQPRRQQQQQASAPAASTAGAYAPEPGTVEWYEEQERIARQRSDKTQPEARPQAAQAAPIAQAAPAASPPPPAQQATYQQASYSGNGAMVNNVRFGEHEDKTRVVLDTSDNVAFNYDLDNTEQILMISMPGTGWQGAEDMEITNSVLVSSYKVVPDNNGGQQMIIQLRQPIRVLWAQSLPPAARQGHRIVIDIAPI